MQSFSQNGVTYIGSIGAGKVYPGARVKSSLASSYMQELIEWRPEIIHSQCEFFSFFLARKISKRLNIPIVHTYHTVYEDYTHYFSPNQRWGRHMAEKVSKWILEKTDCVIAPTGKVRAILEGYGVDREIRVISTGIDLDHFASATDTRRLADLKQTLKIPNDNRILLYTGRLAREKNLEEVLTYFARLNTKKVTLLIVGDGPYRTALEEIAARLGIEKTVVFTGMVSAEHITDYYHLSDLFVSASGSETQGLTFIEALASGLPALCRRDDCLAGVIENGWNGWQYENEADFCEKLECFLSNDNLRKGMSNNAVQTAFMKFSAASFAQNVEQTYTEAVCRRTEVAGAAYREVFLCQKV
jgi:1,2-diacylglycerol 3-alpha-glucosyltransferase